MGEYRGIDVNLGEGAEPEESKSDGVTPILTVLLAALIILAAAMILLVAQQARQSAALVPPPPTASARSGGAAPATATTAAAAASALTPTVAATAPIAASPTVSVAVTATGAAKTAPAAASPTSRTPVSATTTRIAPTATATSANVSGRPAATVTNPVGVGVPVTPRTSATVAPTVRSGAPTVAAPTATAGSAAVPGGTASWSFSGGTTVAPYRTVYTILNPSSQPVSATLTLYQAAGKSVQKTVSVAAQQQVAVAANDLLLAATFGATISSDRPVYASSFVMGGRDGVAAAGMKTAKMFYFPEAQTGDDFTTWLQVFNPGSASATLKVTYLPVGLAALTRNYNVAPLSPLLIGVHKDVPMGILGMIVESSQPVAASYAVYFDKEETMYGGDGLTAASKVWYVASGNTQIGFTARVTVLNPNSGPATVKATLIGSKQAAVSDIYGIEAKSKDDIVLNDRADEQLVAVVLESDIPIVAESVTYYISGDENGPVAAYSAPAIATLAKEWALPDLPASDQYDSYLSLFNPGTSSASVTVNYVASTGAALSKTYTLPAKNRATVRVSDEAAGKEIRAASLASTQPIAVERLTMFRSSVGAVASAGTPLP